MAPLFFLITMSVFDVIEINIIISYNICRTLLCILRGVMVYARAGPFPGFHLK